MSGLRFKNSWSRLDRATHHLAAFQAEWTALAQSRFDTTPRYDPDNEWYVASLTADDKTRERIRNTILPLTLGEFAYQLRAALDGLIWEAVTFTQGAEPPADANRLDFPILNGKNRDFKKCALNDFPFPDKLKTWIESIQPDSAEKPVGHPDRGLANTLETIHNLARLDRHRRLRVIGGVLTELYTDFTFDPPDGFKAVEREGLPCDILGNEYELMRFKVESASGIPPRNIRVETRAKFEVLFEDVPAVQGRPSGEQLGMMCEAVNYVIGRFEEEFAV